MYELPEPWKTAGERKGLTSIRAIARESGASVQTVAMIVAGKRRPTPATSARLAAALGTDPATVDQWAGLPAGETSEPYIPPPESRRMTDRQRRAINEMIRVLVEPAAAAEQLPAGSTKSLDDENVAQLQDRRRRSEPDGINRGLKQVARRNHPKEKANKNVPDE